MPSPGSVFCKVHAEEQSPALLPSSISKESLATLNKEQRKRTANLERDFIFVIEKLLEKKTFGNETKYHVKWENYVETTWEPEQNIPLVFRNYFNKTGKQNIPKPRIKHSKKIGTKVYHLLSWDGKEEYWEEESAFDLEGVSLETEDSDFRCQTRKVIIF